MLCCVPNLDAEDAGSGRLGFTNVVRNVSQVSADEVAHGK